MRETLVSRYPRSTVEAAVTAVLPEPANGVNGVIGVPRVRRHPPHPNLKRLLERAKELVLLHRRTGRQWLASALKIGFAKAGRILGDLESQGIVGPSQPGRNGRAILDETPQTNQRPAPVKVSRRRRLARQAKAAKSRGATPAAAVIQPVALAEISLGAALAIEDLPQQTVGLKQSAKFLERLLGKHPIPTSLRNLAAILEKIEQIRQLVV